MARLRYDNPWDILAAAKSRGGTVRIGHNRWAKVEPSGRVLFGLHQSPLVAWDPDQRTLEIRHAGWRTATTRSAICEFLGLFGPANAADRGALAMFRGEWYQVGADFGAPINL